MKRILVIAGLLYGMAAAAQTPPVTGDTIYGRNPTYLYQRLWADPYDSVIPQTVDYNFEIPGGEYGVPLEYVYYYYTDTPLNIIGLAMSGSISYDVTGWVSVNDTDLTHWCEYLRLYKHEREGDYDTMRLIGERAINILDTTRWMYHFDVNCNVNPFHFYYPVYELYFDKPIVVTDSFYMGATIYYMYPEENGLPQSWPLYYYALEPLCDCWNCCSPETFPCCNQDLRVATNLLRSHYTASPRVTRWKFRERVNSEDICAMWPIIDTTGMNLGPHVEPCGMAENLHVGSMWDGNVLVLWDSVPGHLGWQLALGRADADPESYPVITLASTSKVFHGLDTGEVYAVRVRARCKGEENYSEWSDTVQFVIGGGEGIEDREGQNTYLIPNPAAGKVTVASSYPMRHVEVYDMGGRKLLDQNCTGLSTGFDVSGWPESTYLVVVWNLQGTSVHKLTVDR